MSEEARRDPLSGMQARFNLFARGFARRFFRDIALDDATVERLRALEARGTVVYAMRYASRLDYFLMNALFLRHGLRRSLFANGIRFDYYGTLWSALRTRIRCWRNGDLWRRGVDRIPIAELMREDRSLFVFLRSERLRTWLRGRRHLATLRRADRELLDRALGRVQDEHGSVTVVPVALFWRKGPRNQRRFLNLAYGAPTRPSDFAKVSAFLANYRAMAVKVGEGIDVGEFVAARRGDTRDTLVRKLRRAVLIPLSREEKIVEGPSLRPRHKVAEWVLGSSRVEAAIETRAAGRRRSVEAARSEAESMFREISASMNSTFLAILSGVVSVLFGRLFQSIETTGLDRVAQVAARNPIVLVPNHRSYFDFLLLSWLFYKHYMVPPHIAARENMAFGPFGFIFRRAGAFFLRRSFDDELYKEVFRSYVSFLVREGFPQEFFIEGGRSRTGRTLSPKLGMLSWNIEAFLDSGRRDLFFVPVAITYERLVEESAMLSELAGQRKQTENLRGLLRARKILGRRWGSATIRFDAPISVAAAMGEEREALADDEAGELRRDFVARLGNQIVERINASTAANATSVAAAVFLGAARPGLLRHDLTARMRELVELLRVVGAEITPALEADLPDFGDSVAFLRRSDLIRAVEDERGEILYFEDAKRRALDIYRNSILHFLAPASFTARRLRGGASREELREDLAFWTDLFYHEFFNPPQHALGENFDATLRYFERAGIAELHDGRYRVADKGRAALNTLVLQTQGLQEAYLAAFRAAQAIREPTSVKTLERVAGEAFLRSELLGEIRSPEVASRATFANAFDALVRRRVLARQRDPDARDALVRPGECFDELASLCSQLAGALGDG